MKRVLLDSHIFLWYVRIPSALGIRGQEVIEAADEAFVSVATIWELSIKKAAGKLPEMRPLVDLARLYGFDVLNVTPEHAEAVASLTPLHRDPFDHMLLAQAKVEGLTLVTHDRILAEYGVPVLLV